MLLVNEMLKEIMHFIACFQKRGYAGRGAKRCLEQNPAGKLGARRARGPECVFSAPSTDTAIALLLELRGSNTGQNAFFPNQGNLTTVV